MPEMSELHILSRSAHGLHPCALVGVGQGPWVLALPQSSVEQTVAESVVRNCKGGAMPTYATKEKERERERVLKPRQTNKYTIGASIMAEFNMGTTSLSDLFGSCFDFRPTVKFLKAR